MKKNTRQGQALIEFALVFVLFFSMLIFTVNTILAFVVQQYLSYSTFMAARAFQAAADEPARQKDRACETLKRMIVNLSSCDGLVDEVKLQFMGFRTPLAKITNAYVPTPQLFKYGAGAVSEDNGNFIQLEFKVNLFRTPFLNLGGNLAEITLKSQSFLGREVTRLECHSYFAKVLDGFNLARKPLSSSLAFNMEDNGC